MGKREQIKEIARFAALAVVHKIGGLLNPNAIYAEKYKKEYLNFVQQAENLLLGRNWNRQDREAIREETGKQAQLELRRREYIGEKKFEIMNGEIKVILDLLGIG